MSELSSAVELTESVMVGKGALIEALLKGDFICRTTNEDGWRALQNHATRDSG